MVLITLRLTQLSLIANKDGIIGYVSVTDIIATTLSLVLVVSVRQFGTGIEKDGKIISDPVGTNTDGSASCCPGRC